jgi:DNA-binding LacI/PurR family transcriptional regulator
MLKPPLLHKYQDVARVLKDQILRGDFQKAGRLPSERVLVERFRVQRNTVRQALALLEKEGQISIEKKRGSFVNPIPVAAVGRSFLINAHGGFSPNLSRLRAGFTQAASQAGFSVKLFDTQPPEGAALDPIPDVANLDEDIAGAMVWPQVPTNPAALVSLNASIPLVLVDRRVSGLSMDCVRFADFAGAQKLAEHLIGQGHRRIGFISDEVFAETVHHRWRGYASALESGDIPIDPRLTLFFHGLDASFFALTLRHLLRNGKDAPTAIMCSNDVVALYLLRFLHEEGIRVPDDLAVTGYGNTMPDYADAMALTTVDQPFFELGQSAVNILLERLGQSTADRMRATHDIEIPVQLVVRGSTDSKRNS